MFESERLCIIQSTVIVVIISALDRALRPIGFEDDLISSLRMPVDVACA